MAACGTARSGESLTAAGTLRSAFKRTPEFPLSRARTGVATRSDQHCGREHGKLPAPEVPTIKPPHPQMHRSRGRFYTRGVVYHQFARPRNPRAPPAAPPAAPARCPPLPKNSRDWGNCAVPRPVGPRQEPSFHVLFEVAIRPQRRGCIAVAGDHGARIAVAPRDHHGRAPRSRCPASWLAITGVIGMPAWW